MGMGREGVNQVPIKGAEPEGITHTHTTHTTPRAHTRVHELRSRAQEEELSTAASSVVGCQLLSRLRASFRHSLLSGCCCPGPQARVAIGSYYVCTSKRASPSGALLGRPQRGGGRIRSIDRGGLRARLKVGAFGVYCWLAPGARDRRAAGGRRSRGGHVERALPSVGPGLVDISINRSYALTIHTLLNTRTQGRAARRRAKGSRPATAAGRQRRAFPR